MRIAVFGLGYVGMTAAACLASRGHEVIGIDPSDSKVGAVMSGRSPITEPGLDDMVSAAVDKGLLRATKLADHDVALCDLAIVCVGTPSAPDGSHNMGFVSEVSRQIAELVKAHPEAKMTVAYRSTIRPGTLEDLIYPIMEDVLAGDVSRVELVYNPEFLRESVAVTDFFAPPKIVVGTRTGERSAAIDKMNEGLDAPVFYVRYREAEITKFVDNTFHAVKTAFANEIGRICVNLGIRTSEVHKIFISDTKLNISPYYLRPGGAFGGSCLPKDVRALQYLSKEAGAATTMINSVLDSNQEHKNFLYKISAHGVPQGGKVLLLGLAFKRKSDDLRESPNIELARSFISAGYKLSIFDPFVEPASLMGQNLGALSNLPGIRELMVSQKQMEETHYDVVVDSHNVAHEYNLVSDRVVNINRLD